MAVGGRKPKSPEANAIAGSREKRAVRLALPEPPEGPLGCPPSVLGNPRALAYWRLYLDTTAPGHLAPADAPMLARLCSALALAEEATERVTAEGAVLTGKARGSAGQPWPNPWLGIMNRQTEIARQLAGDLALPPSARARFGGRAAASGMPPAANGNGDAWTS